MKRNKRNIPRDAATNGTRPGRMRRRRKKAEKAGLKGLLPKDVVKNVWPSQPASVTRTYVMGSPKKQYPQAKGAREDYILYCLHEKQLAKSTTIQYDRHIKDFESFLGHRNIRVGVDKVQRADVTDYLAALDQRDIGSLYKRCQQVSLIGFFKYHEGLGALKRNPTALMRLKKVPPPAPNPIPLSEITAIENALDERLNEKGGRFRRLRTALSLAFGSGLRISEVAKLTWEHIDASPEGLGPRVTIRDAKWQSDGVIPLLPETVELLESLGSLPLRQRSGAIFRSRGGRPISIKTLARWLEQIQALIGSERYYTFHQFRAAFVTMLGIAGVPPDVLQLLARHRDFNTTLYYRKYFSQEIFDAFQKHHPRSPKVKSGIPFDRITLSDGYDDPQPPEDPPRVPAIVG